MHDPRSYELASYFLPRGIEEKVRIELAELIQTTVDDFLNYSEFAPRITELESQEH